MVACAEPRSKIPTLSEGVAQHPRRPLVSFLGLARTYIEQTRGISHSPSPLLLTTDDCPPVSDYYWIKSFRCNTYRSPRKCCKQKTYCLAKPFRCNTYKKHGAGVSVMVNQISDEEICPEEHRDEGPLCISDEEICLEEHRDEGPLCISDEGSCTERARRAERPLFTRGERRLRSRWAVLQPRVTNAPKRRRSM